MNNQHIIDSLKLDFDFDNAQQGEAFQVQAVDYVKSRLLVVVDRVFEQFNHVDEVIYIDTLNLNLNLNLDLETIDDKAFYHQLESKLEQQLTSQLSEQLTISRQQNETTSSSSQAISSSSASSLQSTLQSTLSSNQSSKKHLSSENNVAIMSNEQSRLTKLMVYLNKGILPWNAKTTTSSSSNWLDENAQLHLDDIATQLNHADKQASKMATRLFYQLSPELLLRLMSTLTLKAQQLFFPLLSNAAFDNTLGLKSKVDIYNHPSLHRAKTTWWQQKIEDGLQALPATELFIQWSQLITTQASLFVRSIRKHGQQTSVRHIMVNAFSASQLHNVLMLLEPTEHSFINELFNASSLTINDDVLAKNKKNKQNKQKTKHGKQSQYIQDINGNIALSQQHLWLFTFDYLLVERGSVFNRKSYLLNVIKKMAAHHNSDEITLLNTLSFSLSSITNRSSLGQQMLGFVQELKTTFNIPATAKTQQSTAFYSHNTLKITQQLTLVFKGGSCDSIMMQWPNIIKHHHEVLQQLITELGQQQRVLQHISYQFSDKMLLDIVLLLVPSAHQYITQLLPYSSMLFSADNVLKNKSTSSNDKLISASKNMTKSDSKSLPTAHSKALLWEFTLNYLMIERGSKFNRNRYMVSLIKQMASRHNLAYEMVLNNLYSHISRVESTRELQPLQQLLLSLSLQSSEQKLSEQLSNRQANRQEFETTQQTKNNVQTHTKISLLSPTAQQSAINIGEHYSTASNNPIQWLTDFVTALQKADNTALTTWWQTLIQTEPQLLQELLLLHGNTNNVIHNWASALPNKTLTDIVILLAPLHSQFIIDTTKNGSLFDNVLTQSLNRQLKNKNSITSSSQPKQVTQNLWEFSLHYLFTERGSSFNKKSYLSSVLRQLAAHHNLNYELMMQHMLSVITARKNTTNKVTALLTEIAQDTTKNITVTAKSKPKKTSSMITNFSDYQVLSALFGLAKPLPQSLPINSIFTRLKDNNPLLLQRLIKQVLTAKSPWLALTSQLAQHNLTYLLQQLMTLTYVDSLLSTSSQIVNASNALTLINECFKKLTTLAQQQYFMAQLIEQLAGGQLNSRQSINLGELFKAAKYSKPTSPNATHDEKYITTAEVAQPAEKLTEQAIIQQFLLKLTTNSTITTDFKTQLITAIEHLLMSNPAAITQFVERFIESPRLSTHFFKHIPESLLIKLLWSINQTRYQAVESYAELLTQLTQRFIQIHKDSGGAILKETPLHHQYHFIFQYIIGHQKHKNTDNFIHDYCHYLNEFFNQSFMPEIATMLTDDHINVPHSIKEKVIKTMSTKVSTTMSNKASTNRSENINTAHSTLAQQPLNDSFNGDTSQDTTDNIDEVVNQKVLFPEDDEEEKMTDPININNAGLVLLGSYIPRLFTMLSLTEDGVFKSKNDAYKAVHLLQYIVNGATKTPEHELAFNKILCGLPLSEPVPIEVELSDKEKDIIPGLLGAVIQHWSVLGNTSTKVFQETFLEREATLWHDEEQWQLEVVERSFDMLIDQLPWSFSLIKYPWMQEPLYTTWR